MGKWKFSPAPSQVSEELFSKFIIHRVNIVDKRDAVTDSQLGARVGSKSGISVIDSGTNEILLPKSSGAEVDFWVFGDQIVLTHAEPSISTLAQYPALEEFAKAWVQKREEERSLGVKHGLILANLKTHGSEERFLNQLRDLGIPKDEVVLLDQEMPATDRLLCKGAGKSNEPGVALRVSRVESLDSVLMVLRQPETFIAPCAFFVDPNGIERSEAAWPFKKELVRELYVLAPGIKSIICCPSRWISPAEPPAVRAQGIKSLASKLIDCGVRIDYVMTDINLMEFWVPYLRDAE